MDNYRRAIEILNNVDQEGLVRIAKNLARDNPDVFIAMAQAPSNIAELESLAVKHSKIDAIKRIRQETAWDLIKVKEFVEACIASDKS